MKRLFHEPRQSRKCKDLSAQPTCNYTYSRKDKNTPLREAILDFPISLRFYPFRSIRFVLFEIPGGQPFKFLAKPSRSYNLIFLRQCRDDLGAQVS